MNKPRSGKKYHQLRPLWMGIFSDIIGFSLLITVLPALADKYNVKNTLIRLAQNRGYNRIVLQGEGVGNVQGNPYKLEQEIERMEYKLMTEPMSFAKEQKFTKEIIIRP